MALMFNSRKLLHAKKFLVSSPRNTGYIVLLPEIGDDTSNNELPQKDGLPEFDDVTIETCASLITKQTIEFEGAVKEIEKSIEAKEVDMVKDVLEPLDSLSAPLEFTWGVAKSLYLANNTLIPTKMYLTIHERARTARAAKYNNSQLYEAVMKALETKKYKDPEVNRVLNKIALEGKLNGLGLNDYKKQQLKGFLHNLSEEKRIFKQKIDFQNQNFSHTIGEYGVVRDFPPDLLKTISLDEQNPLKGPWKITLQPNIYLPTMQYCPDREIRWNIWNALVSRGSGYLEKRRVTSTNLQEIRFQRNEMAKLLGYPTFAHMSMETKMAGSVDNVRQMIETLRESAKPVQDEEVKNLHEFATQNGFNYKELELWDIPYWRRKQEVEQYNFHVEKYKEYFPYPTVLKGLFELSEKLFKLTIKQRAGVTTWHKDVKFYDVFDDQQSAPVAGFYLDPFAGKEKSPNAKGNSWMIGIQNRSGVCDKMPLATLVFDFDAPSNGSPSYLSLKDVNDLFSKFGHALQHLLTRTKFSEVAGLSNVEWDMVETCGHVYSQFLSNADVLQSISCHASTGEKLPEELIGSMFEVKKHLAGHDLCRELYLSALDLELHISSDYWLKITKDLWPQFRNFKLHKMDSHPCSFVQIFTEEWAAAYYSHVWSRMIAADIYGAFKEAGNSEEGVVEVGKRFRDTFLALGGSVPSSTIFRHFRGRDPSPKALLNQLGIDSSE